ncbi:exodeoxyribonuclease III [Candidatus Tisiphia endosymbiont of Nemotelus uliginosus]|uniref:exodeoxyribonuclease III n=1 Tax=Candidatus Tisiphia endosymbiont of Nemotelus uliginosus TaxID=3077926 RepID=UPI0035C933E8
MKVVTWNINSVRIRLQHLRDLLLEIDPDIVLLQEIKCETEHFPFDELSDLPYNFYVYGQKAYNGVAILSKLPANEVIKDLPPYTNIGQARTLQISLQTPIGLCTFMSLYAPNGSFVGSDKFTAKLKFYDDLIHYLERQKSFESKLIIGGDFNIAPFDIDVYSATNLQDSTCFTIPEKRQLRKILNSGFEDLYRLSHPDKQEFSWWDYRAGSFERNLGMRIDMILASSNAADYLDSCEMHNSWRSKIKPSDHIPVIAKMIEFRPRS